MTRRTNPPRFCGRSGFASADVVERGRAHLDDIGVDAPGSVEQRDDQRLGLLASEALAELPVVRSSPLNRSGEDCDAVVDFPQAGDLLGWEADDLGELLGIVLDVSIELLGGSLEATAVEPRETAKLRHRHRRHRSSSVSRGSSAQLGSLQSSSSSSTRERLEGVTSADRDHDEVSEGERYRSPDSTAGGPCATCGRASREAGGRLELVPPRYSLGPALDPGPDAPAGWWWHEVYGQSLPIVDGPVAKVVRRLVPGVEAFPVVRADDPDAFLPEELR